MFETSSGQMTMENWRAREDFLMMENLGQIGHFNHRANDTEYDFMCLNSSINDDWNGWNFCEDFLKPVERNSNETISISEVWKHEIAIYLFIEIVESIYFFFKSFLLFFLISEI